MADKEQCSQKMLKNLDQGRIKRPTVQLKTNNIFEPDVVRPFTFQNMNSVRSKNRNIKSLHHQVSKIY